MKVDLSLLILYITVRLSKQHNHYQPLVILFLIHQRILVLQIERLIRPLYRVLQKGRGSFMLSDVVEHFEQKLNHNFLLF